jgi:hypothetical protein
MRLPFFSFLDVANAMCFTGSLLRALLTTLLSSFYIAISHVLPILFLMPEMCYCFVLCASAIFLVVY